MFREITQSDLREKKRLVTQESTSLYVSLKNTLAKDELHTLFAEPLPTPNQKKMAWFTHLEGEILPLQALTAEEQARARAELNKQTQAVKNAIAEHQNPELTKLIESLLVVPNENAIFLVRHGDNWHMVLTEWGYIMDVPETETDILYKYLDMPVYTFAFTVQYENGEILPDVVFEVIIKGKNAQTFATDSAGKFNFSLFEGEEVSIKEAQNRYSKEFTAYKNRDELIILSLPAQDMRFEVQDAQNSPTPQSTWIFEYQGQAIEHTSDFQGRIVLPQVPFGVVVKAFQREAGKEINLHTHTCRQEESKYILRLPAQIKPAEPTNMLFRVLKGKKPVEDAKLTLAYLPANADSRRAENLPTNTQGEYAWENVPIGAKVKATASKKFKRRTRTVTKTFTHTEKREAYILRYRSYWWLLWFLLLLLLFIRCEKTVFVKVLNSDSKQPIANASVDFRHNTHYLYDKGQFFTNTNIKRTQTTNTKGVTKFDTVCYSVYGYIFYHLAQARFSASHDCYKNSTASRYFHWIWHNDTITLYQNPKKIPLDFKVIDKSDKEPLPQVSVKVIAELDGKQYEETLTSEADGRVVTSNIPQCAKIKKVRASLDGYYPDSLAEKTALEFLGGTLDSMRTLRLRPIRKPIAFFVVECNTNPPKPIPNATVTIEIVGKKKIKVKTNVNGVGKGVYDSLHVKAKIALEARKDYYKRGRLEGDYTVGDFIKLPDEKRTICLERDPNPAEFKNIDEKTKQPLSGVRNIVRRKKGKETHIDTLTSNREGVFVVGDVEAGEEISIVAQYPPDYEDNDRTVKDKAGKDIMDMKPEERVIPLKPVELELVFRAIDGENGELIPNAQVVVLQNGIALPTPNSSGNGTFKATVRANALISVQVRKNCYGQNITKIVNRSARSLFEAPQTERDIPLTRSILARVTKCYNKKRPWYNVFIDGRFIKKIYTSDDTDVSPSKASEDIDIRGLRSGRHTFKFVKVAGDDIGVCGGCTHLKLDCVGVDHPFVNQNEIVWEVDIP